MRAPALVLLAALAAGCPSKRRAKPEADSTKPPPAALEAAPREFVKAFDPELAPTLEEPEQVSATDSQYREDEPVIGLVGPSGEARAYSLWQLERTPIVSDFVQGLAIAIVHDPVSLATAVYLRPKGADGPASFGVTGLVSKDAMVIHDRETLTLYSALTGLGLSGKNASTPLEEYPAQLLPWSWWLALHPHSTALKRDVHYASPLATTGVESTSAPLKLPSTTLVLGVRGGGAARAYPIDLLQGAINDTLGGLPIVVVPIGGSAVALVRLGPGGALTMRRGPDRLVDAETGSSWTFDGRAFEGPLAGTGLTAAPSARIVRWGAWYAAFRGSTVWVPPAEPSP